MLAFPSPSRVAPDRGGGTESFDASSRSSLRMSAPDTSGTYQAQRNKGSLGKETGCQQNAQVNAAAKRLPQQPLRTITTNRATDRRQSSSPARRAPYDGSPTRRPEISSNPTAPPPERTQNAPFPRHPQPCAAPAAGRPAPARQTRGPTWSSGARQRRSPTRTRRRQKRWTPLQLDGKGRVDGEGGKTATAGKVDDEGDGGGWGGGRRRLTPSWRRWQRRWRRRWRWRCLLTVSLGDGGRGGGHTLRSCAV